ncbi:MAG: flagellar hook-length control protein FliK [Treponemataceae bacterium]|nr:flagellar hook-length control protein FliK [Treponemataceae bacterium]
MQTMSLRFEQMVNAAPSMSQEKTQGFVSASQNDSSFKAAFEKAQKELDSEKTAKTTDGNVSVSKNNETSQETKDDISEKDLKWIDSDSEVSEKLEPTVKSSKNIVLEKDADLLQNLKTSRDLKEIDLKVQDKVETADVMPEEKLDFTFDELVAFLDENSEPEELMPAENEMLAATEEVSEKEISSEELLYALLTGNSVTEQSEAAETAKNPSEINENKEFGFDEKSKKIQDKKSAKEPVITVQDERTVAKTDAKTAENFVTSIEKTENGEVTMTMNLNSSNQANLNFEGNVNPAMVQTDSSKFATMLSQQIQTSSADFVKAGNLVLKDDNRGVINLVLHPEDLGNVKIQLELADKVISGKIVVATKEAFDAFNQNMNSLRDAFIKEGFQAPTFDLSWSGNENNGQKNAEREFYAHLYENNVMDSPLQDTSDPFYGNSVARDAIMYGSSMINIIA